MDESEVVPVDQAEIRIHPPASDPSASSSGKIVSLSVGTAGVVGIALIRLDHVFGGSDYREYFIHVAGRDIRVKVLLPQWWPDIDPSTGKQIHDTSNPSE